MISAAWVFQSLDLGMALMMAGFGLVLIINTVLVGIWAGRVSEKISQLQGQFAGMWEFVRNLPCKVCDLPKGR